jgi:signal transduction histidine kinase
VSLTFDASSNSLPESNEELGRLVLEQAALRRVATFVARGEPPSMIFTAVAKEVAQVLHVNMTRLVRYLPDGSTEVVGMWGGPGEVFPVGCRCTIEGDNLQSRVLRSGAPARMDCFGVSPICVFLKRHGIRSGVGTPITVSGKCWGVMLAYATDHRLLPRNAELRVCDFTDLVATAIANAQAHSELVASRARIVAAGDHARRRIERDLHDGIQQQLTSLAIELRAVIDNSLASPEIGTRLSAIADRLAEALNNVQETARGVHPAILTKGGLMPTIKWLTRRCGVPARLDVCVATRLPDSIEVAAYYVVAEALTNSMKYAQATCVHIQADIVGGRRLRVSVRDDGVGGADPARGSGLTGLIDRVEALNGTLEITSPLGKGTLLRAELPCTRA